MLDVKFQSLLMWVVPSNYLAMIGSNITEKCCILIKVNDVKGHLGVFICAMI